MIELLKKYLWNKTTLAIICAGIVVVFFILIIKRQSDIATKQATIEASVTAQKQLQDGILRSQSQYVTADDLNKYTKDINLNLAAISKDLKILGANVVGVNTINVTTPGYINTNLGSTRVEPKVPDVTVPGVVIPITPECKTCDKYGYQQNKQYFDINEKFANDLVPFGSAGFEAWKDKPWSINVLPRNYQVTTVVGQDEDGKTYTYNKFSINVDGKDHDVQIQQGKFIQEFPQSKFYFWNPRLYLGTDFGYSTYNKGFDASPNINVSLMSYGKLRIAPDWNFLQFGLGLDLKTQKPNFTFMPVSFNIGKQLHPLVQNTYIGPTVSVDTAGNYTVGIGIRVGL